LNEIKVNCIY